MLACPQCFGEFQAGHMFCPRDGSPLRAVRDPLIGATLLGQFEIREVLGEGASGTVYRAWQAPMERFVAIKVLHPELAHDPAMVARMEREARAIGRLTHPGVVTVYAAGTTPSGCPFLVMELVDGVTLASALVDEPMAAERVVAIGLEIAGALGASHDAGVVHRDLKPENVMLVGRDCRVVVLDFGVAKLVGGALVNGDGQLTADGAICGTPHYIAPEQAAGEPLDHRADLYSLGVLLYRLATGRLPFDGNPVAVLLGHAQDIAPTPSSIAPVPQRLSDVIERCLAKRPDDRYPSAMALMDALSDCVRPPRWTEVAPTVEATAISIVAEETAQLPVRRTSRFLTAVFAMTLAAAGGFFGNQALEGPEAARVTSRVVLPRDVVARAAAAPVPATPDVVSGAAGPPRRAVVVGQDGYSMRLLLPERILVGVDYEVLLEVWDPEGQPINTSEMIVTLDDPGASSRGVAAKPTDQAGLYRFSRRFDAAGPHQLRVYPPAGGTSIRVFVEVIDPSVGSS